MSDDAPRSAPPAKSQWDQPRLRRLGTVRDIAMRGDGDNQGNGRRGNNILS